MMNYEQITLAREVIATAIPSGEPVTLSKDALVTVTQALGGSFTLMNDSHQLFRLEGKDGDAIGREVQAAPDKVPVDATLEQLVMGELRTCFDPEIPVNVVDLGLVYDVAVTPVEPEGSKVEVKMTLTAPGCGMGDILKRDAEQKIAALPTVKSVSVELVLEPPWDKSRMSEAARLTLGYY